MKLFECPQLARCGPIITIGFAEEQFLFVCCEMQDVAGRHVRTILISRNDLINPRIWRGSNSEIELYKYNVKALKKLFRKFSYCCLKDDSTKKNLDAIMHMLRNNNYSIYQLIKDCDPTVDVEIGSL